MKDCDIIQPELSAYVDGELAPHLRELVEGHLASCPQCREAVAELRTLAAGVAELPKLATPPRFLVEVRAKIARGDNPEESTWQDYLFRPFWIKVPLELVAVVAVTVLVARFEERQRAETVSGDQFAQVDNSANEESSVPAMRAKSEPPAVAKSAPRPQPPSSAAAPESKATGASAGEPVPSQEARTLTENGAGSSPNITSESPVGSYRLLSSPAEPVVAAGGGTLYTFEPRRRVASVDRGAVGIGTALTPSPEEVSTLARSAGIEPSKITGVVVVHSKDLSSVQGRAEQLAARCNGSVIPVSPSMGSSAQIFFVEVPRAYAASFRLDMEQNTASSAPATGTVVDGVPAVPTNGPLLSATSTAQVVGVLTGAVETNTAFYGLAQLSLGSNPRAQAAATTVLEIVVEPPPGPGPTNTTPIPATPAN